MTKKDYELIAEILKKELLTWNNGTMGKNAVRSVCYGFSELLQRQNPRFNPSKFLTACGIE